MQSEYYLAYRPPEEHAERERLAKELAGLGAVRLHYSLWRVPLAQIRQILNMVRGRHAIVLKRGRGISSPSFSSQKSALDIGTVAVIAYRLPPRSSKKRVALSRALGGVPALKIGRCLYLVPHLRASKASAYNGKVLTAFDLFRLLEEEGISVARLSRLQVVYPANQEPLLRAYVEAQVDKIERLNRACRRLREAATAGRLEDPGRIRKLLSSYRLRYRSLRGIAMFLYREMGVDLRPVLKRTYVALTSCRVLLEPQMLG